MPTHTAPDSTQTVAVRYIVADVADAAAFYTRCLGFSTIMAPARGFAMLGRGPLRLLLNAPGSGGGGTAGGTSPKPGGWNRIQLRVADLDGVVEQLRTAGAAFRGPVVDGRGGRQALVEDPSGNLVEVFQPWPDEGSAVAPGP